ncbi:MAG: hypothetical protein K1X53_04205 [Candidatus Sumerlaeaceae bacterium]|nr:hypothetical protein [Candidatus Sumerlaeaceae bacterium]
MKHEKGPEGFYRTERPSAGFGLRILFYIVAFVVGAVASGALAVYTGSQRNRFRRQQVEYRSTEDERADFNERLKNWAIAGGLIAAAAAAWRMERYKKGDYENDDDFEG